MDNKRVWRSRMENKRFWRSRMKNKRVWSPRIEYERDWRPRSGDSEDYAGRARVCAKGVNGTPPDFGLCRELCTGRRSATARQRSGITRHTETALRTSAAMPADITGSHVTIAARSSLGSAGSWSGWSPRRDKRPRGSASRVSPKHRIQRPSKQRVEKPGRGTSAACGTRARR